MNIFIKPRLQQWAEICERPSLSTSNLDEVVSTILYEVKQNGDRAINKFNLRFDGVSLDSLLVSSSDFEQAEINVADELKEAIAVATENIRKFHESQQQVKQRIETMPGVICWRENVAIERVGLYIPGGSAPLFSTILMLVIPALIAGCKEIILCTPADINGKIPNVILYTAQFLGVTHIYKIGGAQAIAAMAYGTESVPKTNKIFGPGNQYVTKAKELVQKEGIAIDLPAGPSEVLVITDAYANPYFVAADLLSQAEHGPDSQVILVSTSINLIEEVQQAINQQLNELPRVSIAKEALKNSRVIVLDTLEECIHFSNCYAPEHLILAFDNPQNYLKLISNAGSVFIGPYSCESAGDYASGTNHTLPTNGYAKSYSGVSVDSFVKKITFQEINKAGLQLLGPSVERMAEAEGLIAHRNAVRIRLNTPSDEK